MTHNTIWLLPEHADSLAAHTERESPREACGLIAGREGRVVEIIPIANSATQPETGYYMDEADLARALLGLEGRGLSLLAFYHSHPKSDPLPSPADLRAAAYPDVPYLIVRLRHSTLEITAWYLSAAGAEPVDVHIGTDAPPPQPFAALSHPARMAILLAAAIAVILLLVVSLSLLPPAPPIPGR